MPPRNLDDPQLDALIMSRVHAALATLAPSISNDLQLGLSRQIAAKINDAIVIANANDAALRALICDLANQLSALQLAINQAHLANAALQTKLDDYISKDRYALTRSQVVSIMREESDGRDPSEG